MKAAITMLAALALVGCSMTPTQRKVTAVAVVVVATGALAAHQHKSQQHAGIPRPPDCQARPELCR